MLCERCVSASLVSVSEMGCAIRICAKVTNPVRSGSKCVGSAMPSEICHEAFKMVSHIRLMFGSVEKWKRKGYMRRLIASTEGAYRTVLSAR